MNEYIAPFPVGADPRDVFAVSLANLPVPPDFPQSAQPDGLHVQYITVALTGPQLTAWRNAVAATVADPNAPYRVLDTANANLQNVVAVLRNQAAQARATTVTSGNAVNVLQTVVNDLGIFCDRLADLIIATRIGS